MTATTRWSLLLALLLSTPSQAEPAPWYWWISLIDGQRHCAQTSPGPGWRKGPGPYRDIRCEKPLHPLRR